MTTEQDVAQVAQQAAQDLAQAVQAAKQVAQQIQEAIGQTQRSVVDASKTSRPQEVGSESEFETGSDEYWKFASQINGINAKRTYDEYQQESLDGIRINRSLVSRLSQNAVTHDEQVQNVALQALQNAVETANMIGKQAVAHRDIAIDREWNVDEVSTLTAKSGAQADAFVTLLADAIAARIGE